ncbi:MAG: tellurite resistance TerB family protein [Tagaea sp.]
MLTPHAALVHIMVVVAAADGDMPDGELQRMGQVCRLWPVFKGFDIDTLPDVARECAVMLQVTDGLDKTLARVRQSLPAHLRETAYLLACDVAAVDAGANWQEARVLDQLRHALGLDRLTCAALERATEARYAPAK